MKEKHPDQTNETIPHTLVHTERTQRPYTMENEMTEITTFFFSLYLHKFSSDFFFFLLALVYVLYLCTCLGSYQSNSITSSSPLFYSVSPAPVNEFIIEQNNREKKKCVEISKRKETKKVCFFFSLSM